jgi:hypothetical protein
MPSTAVGRCDGVPEPGQRRSHFAPAHGPPQDDDRAGERAGEGGEPARPPGAARRVSATR